MMTVIYMILKGIISFKNIEKIDLVGESPYLLKTLLSKPNAMI